MSLAAGALGFAAPAYADGVTVQLQDNTYDLRPGGSDTLSVQVTNTGQTPDVFDVTVTAPSAVSSDVVISRPGCTSGATSRCNNVSIKSGDNQILQFQIRVNQTVSVPAGQTKQGTGTVKAASDTNFAISDSKNF
jgi:uncharacterized membrane protein